MKVQFPIIVPYNRTFLGYVNIFYVFFNIITNNFFEAVERSDAIAKQADVVAAMTLEVLKGTSKAFESGMLCPRYFLLYSVMKCFQT